jgi:ABC-2 type transport system permease protein
MTALLRRSVAQARYVLGGSLVVLCGFQLIIVGQAAEIEQTQSFGGLADLLPIFLKQGLGNRVMLLASFRGIVAFGYFHPVICALLAMVAMYVATEPAHEIESGLVDLELARSLPRHRLLTRSLLLVVLAVAAGLSLMFAGTSIGARLFGAPIAQLPSVAVRLLLLAHLGAIAVCFGSVGLWLASVSRRWTTAFTTGALLILVTYLLDFLAIGWAPMRHVAWISPFHYYPALAIVAGDDAGSRNLLVLLSSAVVFTAAAYVRFQRRDL